jgi:dTDP-4-dehydrorhamnose reductase
LDADRKPQEAAAGDRPVVVVGAAGQLGRTMVVSLGRGWPTIGATRAELDLSDAAAVRRAMDAWRPRAIVNCAGYNHVDRAETEPVAAFEANAFAVLNLARAAERHEALLVHYSSDFVFDGETDRPYVEADPPEPQSTYAASKLLGEWFAAVAPAQYVLRVESLFGGVGPRKSSMDKILDAIAAGHARVFVDRTVSPSYAWDVAAATARLIERRPPYGTYHCVNTGSATWHDLAVEARRLMAVEATLEPIRLGDVALPASRPRYCALSNEKLRQAGVEMPGWQEALARAVDEREGGRGRTKNKEQRTKNGT